MVKIEITGDTPREALVSVTAYGMYCMTNDEIREAAAQLMAETVNKNRDNDHTEPERCTPPPVVTPPAAPAVPHLAPTAAPVVPPPVAAPMASPTIAPASASPVMGGPATNVSPFNPTATAAPVAASPVAPVQAPVAPAPSFTPEQVGKAGADLVSANPAKMPELLALLQQFGVPAISELKPEQLGGFATALRGLGAKI